MRESSVSRLSHQKGTDEKARPLFTFLNLPLAKNLESGEKWKERK